MKGTPVDAAATAHNVEFAHLSRWTKWLAASDEKAGKPISKRGRQPLLTPLSP